MYNLIIYINQLEINIRKSENTDVYTALIRLSFYMKIELDRTCMEEIGVLSKEISSGKKWRPLGRPRLL